MDIVTIKSEANLLFHSTKILKLRREEEKGPSEVRARFLIRSAEYHSAFSPPFYFIPLPLQVIQVSFVTDMNVFNHQMMPKNAMVAKSETTTLTCSLRLALKMAAGASRNLSLGLKGSTWTPTANSFFTHKPRFLPGAK